MAKKSAQRQVPVVPTDGEPETQQEDDSRGKLRLTSPAELEKFMAAKVLAHDVAMHMRRQLACLDELSFAFSLMGEERALQVDSAGISYLFDAIAEYTRADLFQVLTSRMPEREAAEILNYRTWSMRAGRHDESEGE